jgi:hypothetical protein
VSVPIEQLISEKAKLTADMNLALRLGNAGEACYLSKQIQALGVKIRVRKGSK